MAARLPAQTLRAKYQDETVHSDHVAKLALRLFDRLHGRLAIPPRCRGILEWAARLHDIGFRDEPADHAAAGARVVLAEGLPDATAAERAAVAAAIHLHAGGELDRLLAEPLVAGLRAKRQALGVAALLRVADGLDHAHIQNVAICSIRTAGGAVRVGVRSDGFPDNVRSAQLKGDLWNRVFPLDIDVGLVPPPRSAPLFAGVVRPEDSALEAARRILCHQYRVFANSARAALTDRDPENLHDLRVAMRRFRVAMRVFRRVLPGVVADDLDRRLAATAAKLSPLRDHDVWLAFIEGRPRRKRCAADPAWPAYLASMTRRAGLNRGALLRILRSREYAALTADVVRFLRIDLPRELSAGGGGPLRPFFARKLAKAARKTVRHGKPFQGMSADELHRLRKSCRRGRYVAEFAAPVFTPEVGRLGRRLKAVADDLGDIHDLDVHLAELADAGIDLPALGGLLTDMRESAVAALDRDWRRLHRICDGERLDRSLSAAREEEKQ
ncbi:CHAD domain-containing protein [Verrucomicrobiota bacterium]